MSNFCPKCGAELREGAKFCASCGQKISDDSSPKIELQKSSTAQLDAPPPEDTTPHYKEDVTIREMFLTSEGRLNRWRYFKRTLAVFLVYLLVGTIIILTCSTPLGDLTQTGDALLVVAAVVIVLIPSVMLTVRRLQDLNKSGWYYLVIFVPFIGVLFSLYVIFAPGTVGPNKYGADPLENKRR